MFFKIINIGDPKYKYSDMGMINVDAAFYLEAGDEGFDKYQAEHYAQVPVIPAGGYPGKLDDEGVPADKKAFGVWLAALPKVWQFNPFCNHSIQFEPSVTKEEILYCFDLALVMTHENYLKNDLECKVDGRVVNQSINYESRKVFYDGIKNIPEAEKTIIMKAAEQLKIAAVAKLVELNEADINKTKTAGEYKVK